MDRRVFLGWIAAALPAAVSARVFSGFPSPNAGLSPYGGPIDLERVREFAPFEYRLLYQTRHFEKGIELIRFLHERNRIEWLQLETVDLQRQIAATQPQDTVSPSTQFPKAVLLAQSSSNVFSRTHQAARRLIQRDEFLKHNHLVDRAHCLFEKKYVYKRVKTLGNPVQIIASRYPGSGWACPHCGENLIGAPARFIEPIDLLTSSGL